MVRSHHQLNRYEFAQILGDRNVQGWSITCPLHASNGQPGMLQSMGSQRVGHDLATEQEEDGASLVTQW